LQNVVVDEACDLGKPMAMLLHVKKQVAAFAHGEKSADAATLDEIPLERNRLAELCHRFLELAACHQRETEVLSGRNEIRLAVDRRLLVRYRLVQEAGLVILNPRLEQSAGLRPERGREHCLVARGGGAPLFAIHVLSPSSLGRLPNPRRAAPPARLGGSAKRVE
jgi:hypothetical protein